ncbi:diphthamide biosynthesis protein [Phlyctochytrium arcticum]|nr:diphthamide biosynthesis protein [Phlyctochytrium arcticum]
MAAFSTDSSDIMLRQIESAPANVSMTSQHPIFDINPVIDLINVHKFKKVALQFADEHLPSSVNLARDVQDQTSSEVFVLGDTTFGSCCADEVAAEHGLADVVVHFGRACLSPYVFPIILWLLTTRLPVIYCFPLLPIDVPACIQKFTSLYKSTSDQTVHLKFDVSYVQCADELVKTLTSLSYNVTHHPIPSICFPVGDTVSPGDAVDSSGNSDPSIPPAESPAATGDHRIFYVGGESLTLTNLVLTHSSSAIHAFDPATNEIIEASGSCNKLLMRRYFMVQKARDADVVGIVVGTLGVASYLHIINSLKKLIQLAGKKPYLLAVGKPNPAKLGNFLEIDVFCLIACPENSILDSKEYLRPIVTPFELEMALRKTQEWTGAYETSFGVLAPRLREAVEGGGMDDETSDEDNDTPYFSLATGEFKQRATRRRGPTQPTPDSSTNDSQLTLRTPAGEVSTTSATSHAASFLQSRIFRGLDPALENSSVKAAVQGRTGIAKGYAGEDAA